MRRPDGVTAIAIYYFLIAIPCFIGACAILVFPIPSILSSGQGGSGLIGALFGVGLGLLATLVGGVLSAIAGWGLLALKEWARWLAIALAIVSLVFIPIGTILGALIIYYLLRDEVRGAFQAAG